MGYLTGLAAVNEMLAKRPSNNDDFEDRPKTRWLTLKKDGDAARLVFLQELDESADNYSEKNGLGRFVLEHSNPDNWQKKAECTISDGACYGCEQGWYQKVTLYINVLVDDGNEEPYVAIFNRGLGKGSAANVLRDEAIEEGSITDKWFRFKREGEKKKTSYILLPSKAHDLNVEDYELFDLDHVPFKVKYERQEAYYLDGQVAEEANERETVGTTAGGSSADAEW